MQADDEDDDPYTSTAGPSNSNRHFAFDDGEDEPIVIGDTSTSSSTGASRFGRPGASRDTYGQSSVDPNRYHDGRPVLAGFELDPLGVPADKW